MHGSPPPSSSGQTIGASVYTSERDSHQTYDESGSEKQSSESPGSEPDQSKWREYFRTSWTPFSVGIVAFALLVLLSRVTVWFQDPGERLADEGFEESAFTALPGAEELSLWVLFQAHNVNMDISGSQNDPEASAAIADATLLEPGVLVVIVPIVLIAAGLTSAVGIGCYSVERAVTGGAAIALSYLPLVAVANWIAEYNPGAITVGFTGSEEPGQAILGEDWGVGFVIQPEPGLGILLAGVLYPVIFGAIGGLFGYVLLKR